MVSSEEIQKAIALHRAGKLQEAAHAYREILRRNPADVDALNLLGTILVGAGLYEQGEALARQAISISPNYAAPFITLGNALHGAGQYEEAAEVFRTALAIDGNEPAAYNNLASTLNELRRYDEAMRVCLSGLALTSKMPALYNNLGNAMESKGEFVAAEQNYRKALTLDKKFPDALYNLGTLLSDVEKIDEAIPLLENAVLVDPDHAEKHYNLANTLRRSGRFDDARRYYENAIQLSPEDENITNNLAITMQMQGCLKDAIKLLRTAIKSNPENPDLHWNLALILLELGEFEEGWLEYEWRWKSSSFTSPQLKLTSPVWCGGDIKDKTLLVICEQGFGDHIQFSRYLPLIAEKEIKIIVVCRPELRRLFNAMPSVKQALDWGDTSLHYDYYISLMSLPNIFGTILETIPNCFPYLPSIKNSSLAEKICNTSGLKVGLVWAGSSTRQSDKFRSFHASSFDPLVKLTGASFFSLQVGEKSAELYEMSNSDVIIDLGSDFMDFADTSAAILELDLIISVDTAVAHLAGAFGIPVWIILSNPAGYLWMRNRTDTPWYPSARLYRQDNLDDWARVLEEIFQDLSNLIAKIDD